MRRVAALGEYGATGRKVAAAYLAPFLDLAARGFRPAHYDAG
ncbi:hypothetical protein ABT299_34785 [Spirillospora sp. NPDC000708]